MHMVYADFSQKVLCVDENDVVTKSMDKWKVHKEGILHRAFTLILVFNNSIVLQHRKHLVFDNVLDATLSSHQLMIQNGQQNDIEAVMQTVLRETNLKESNFISQPNLVGTVRYQARQKDSKYIENEFLHVYKGDVSKQPEMNDEFAYNQYFAPISQIRRLKKIHGVEFAPWVEHMVRVGLFNEEFNY